MYKCNKFGATDLKMSHHKSDELLRPIKHDLTYGVIRSYLTHYMPRKQYDLFIDTCSKLESL